MKRSNPLVSQCEMSGSGVLLVEGTMCRQSPIFQEFQHERRIFHKRQVWIRNNVGSRLVRWFWLIKSLGKIIQNPAIDLMVLINKKFVPGESQISHTNSLSCSCHAPTTTSLAQIIQFLHIVLGVRFIRKFGPRNFQIWKNYRIKEMKRSLMNKRNEKIPDPQNCFRGAAINQYPQIVWGGGGGGRGGPLH